MSNHGPRTSLPARGVTRPIWIDVWLLLSALLTRTGIA